MTLERTSIPQTPAWPIRPARSRLRAGAPAARRIAYLVSQYPKVSHSFIRREILALERRGWQIARFSIRGWDSELVDADDIAEFAKTTFVLKHGAPGLASAVLRQAARAPRRFLKAIALCVRMMRRSDRPSAWHLIYLAEACWLARRLAREGITHLHAHFGTNPADVALLVHALTGMSYSVTVHGPEEFDRGRHINLGEKIRGASFVAAISSFCRSQLYRAVGRQYWPRIHVVHCGIDTAFSTIDAVLPAQAARLVCVGRLCEQKGQLILVKAAAVLAAEGRKFRLVLVGDGEDRAEIERLIAEQNLGSVVQILGWASAQRVKEEMLAARALVLPSLAEGLPIVLIEAMILGRPVLSTYVAGIPELVTPDTGWLFPAGSDEELVAAMRACLDAPATALKSMGEAARARALERHGIDRQASDLTSLFEAALGEVR